MTLNNIEWKDQGYNLLLVEAKDVTDNPLQSYFHLLVSADGVKYAIYDRFHARTLAAARAAVRFNPTLYEAVSPPFPISKDRALRGETGIPLFMEPIVQYAEKLPWPGDTISPH